LGLAVIFHGVWNSLGTCNGSYPDFGGISHPVMVDGTST
jgi:hypothetical protein